MLLYDALHIRPVWRRVFYADPEHFYKIIRKTALHFPAVPKDRCRDMVAGPFVFRYSNAIRRAVGNLVTGCILDRHHSPGPGWPFKAYIHSCHDTAVAVYNEIHDGTADDVLPVELGDQINISDRGIDLVLRARAHQLVVRSAGDRPAGQFKLYITIPLLLYCFHIEGLLEPITELADRRDLFRREESDLSRFLRIRHGVAV